MYTVRGHADNRFHAIKTTEMKNRNSELNFDSHSDGQ